MKRGNGQNSDVVVFYRFPFSPLSLFPFILSPLLMRQTRVR